MKKKKNKLRIFIALGAQEYVITISIHILTGIINCESEFTMPLKLQIKLEHIDRLANIGLILTVFQWLADFD